MPNKPQNFWKFSLELYDREGVAAACLALQEEYQLDVNLLLFCYWHGSNFGVIDTERLPAGHRTSLPNGAAMLCSRLETRVTG